MAIRVIHIVRLGAPLMEYIWRQAVSVDSSNMEACRVRARHIDTVFDLMFDYPQRFEVYYATRYCDYWEPELYLRKQIPRIVRGKMKVATVYASTLVCLSPDRTKDYDPPKDKGSRMLLNRLTEALASTPEKCPLLICFKTMGPSENPPKLSTADYETVFSQTDTKFEN